MNLWICIAIAFRAQITLTMLAIATVSCLLAMHSTSGTALQGFFAVVATAAVAVAMQSASLAIRTVRQGL